MGKLINFKIQHIIFERNVLEQICINIIHIMLRTLYYYLYLN